METRWPPKRIAALALTVVLISLEAVAIYRHTELKYLLIIGMGIILGGIYTVLSRMPDAIISASDGGITEDDDPKNINPKIYLPILVVAILVAIALVWYFLHG